MLCELEQSTQQEALRNADIDALRRQVHLMHGVLPSSSRVVLPVLGYESSSAAGGGHGAKRTECLTAGFVGR